MFNTPISPSRQRQHNKIKNKTHKLLQTLKAKLK